VAPGVKIVSSAIVTSLTYSARSQEALSGVAVGVIVGVDDGSGEVADARGDDSAWVGEGGTGVWPAVCVRCTATV